jgi:hypothetical protein
MPKLLPALLQLGPKPLALYGFYRLGLKLGIPQRAVTQARRVVHDWQAAIDRLQILLLLPEKEALRLVIGAPGLQQLIEACSEILAGKVRLFGAEAVELHLPPAGPLLPWENYESGKVAPASDQDIKFTWEPGRLGWAFTLGRGYYLTGDERYSQAFWANTEKFIEANPPYLGPNWSSAQEVALRLIALAWSLRIFLTSSVSTPERQARLVQVIADHAARIPPTLLYARSQNNNHLLSEAAGLYTAGLLLEDYHPEAGRWRKLGWRWFQQGVLSQVASDGAYSQHSANYQRLMLQLALWMNLLQKSEVTSSQSGDSFSPHTLERLQKATCWLVGLLDRESGKLPNLGPNDGAYIFPFTDRPFDDYRPVLQAAVQAFCQETLNGKANEMSLWFGCVVAPGPVQPVALDRPKTATGQLKLTTSHSWAYLRAVHFTSRPGHADQLHMDLWWRGLNLAQDAGTYRYTASAPWDNALSHAAVHNTVTVDGQDQMRRAGRFLYLDWAQAEHSTYGASSISARHNGYRKLGILHSRSITSLPGDCWVVEDRLVSVHSSRSPGSAHTFRLHWLLPDWPWYIEAQTLTLESPLGPVKIEIDLETEAFPAQPALALVRRGQRIYGANEPPHTPILGWVSPTYSMLQPALSLVIETHTNPPVRFITTWTLPNIEALQETRSLR